MPSLTCPHGHPLETPPGGVPWCPTCTSLDQDLPPGRRPVAAFQELANMLAAGAPAESGAIPAAGPTVAALVPGQASLTDLPTVPGYEILKLIGCGGMGVVYKARHLALQRLVALKMILPGGLVEPDAAARFDAEAKAVARLQHPNIVQILDVGKHEGRPFFSLEFMTGGSLAQHLDGTPLPPRFAAGFLETLAEAMHYAHQRGLVHRDLKPSNVLLQFPDGRPAASGNLASAVPKISDFGLVKYLDADSAGQTHSGAILGTPSYMAPEQAEGKSKEISPATDVYALGAILYELLTGRPPFRGTDFLETLDQVRHQEPVSPRSMQPGVPRDLETICLKCLQKDRRKRYESALELAEDLHRFLEDKPIHARPVRAPERAWRWCRRNPAVAGLLTAVALALLAGTVVSTFFAVLAGRREEAAIVNAERADKNASTAEANAKRAAYRAYIADMRQAEYAWEKGQMGMLAEVLEAQRPENNGGHELRGFEWRYWSLRSHAELRRFNGRMAVSFSPDGRLLASAGDDKTVKVWEAATGRELLTLRGHSEPVDHVAFSPDGRRLASCTWGAIPAGGGAGEGTSPERKRPPAGGPR